MVTKFEDLDLNGTYTFADYLTWAFKERVEIIKGKLFKMAMPTEKHQRISSNIFGAFSNYIKQKKYRIYYSGFHVRLSKSNSYSYLSDNFIDTVLQPDMTIICDTNKIDTMGCLGAPDLIIEILSPSTGAKDLKDKKEVYEFSGVKEYWIVSPEDETLTVFLLNEQGKYVFDNYYANIEVVKVHIFDDLDIDLKDIFEIYE